MDVTADRVVAVVGLGAVLPDARNVAEFWSNVKQGRYSISDVPPDRWDPALYYDPDPKAPDKSYSRIGGWVRAADWEPVKWRLPIPPRVSDAMDWAQKWAIGCTLQALNDFGYPGRPLDPERTAIILGNAMGGERHYQTALRASFPEYARQLSAVPDFAALPADVRDAISRGLHDAIDHLLPPITEDSMPGELSNCIAGRLANLLNFRGPNFVVDAACASAMAAFSAAVEGLVQKRYDAVITGGIDRNMGAQTFIKFCKIGALSATGSRPYADGADGFVMGEGAAIFLMKRLADAERDGDKIYAVLRGVGGSSDGKGKGITAPNPVGQRLAMLRAWENAGLSPCGVGLIEGHGTSTAVGDLVEVESLIDVFGKAGCKEGSVGLGSVKGNIGHLKSAAGAAGVMKAVLALHEKVLPPSVNFNKPNPGVDFAASPFRVVTELRPWERSNGTPRQAGVSAFGFGGTNFHVVLEEHVPGRFVSSQGPVVPGFDGGGPSREDPKPAPLNPGVTKNAGKSPLRGALLLGASSDADVVVRLRAVAAAARAGQAPSSQRPTREDLQAAVRVAVDYGNAAELAEKCDRAIRAFESGNAAMWKALRAQGIFKGTGTPGRIAFLYPGQGSQYLNMLRSLRDVEPIVAETFAEADAYTVPLLGKPISQYLFVDPSDKAATEKAEEELKQTAITQPAVLTVDAALTRLLGAYGITADMVMGHSLGEYGALVAAGAMPLRDALEAVSARGREMTKVSMADNGWMVAAFAPLAEIERIIATVDGDVVIANINSNSQSVIGGASAPVEKAMQLLQQAGYTAVRLPVSHAFHTSIVAPASEPMRRQLQRLHLEPPHIPIVSNVTGGFYPTGEGVVPQMVDLLAKQIAAPVQFIKGLQTLYEAGARLFVEVGPKKALQGFAEEAFANHADALAVFTNHPKFDDRVAFNQALCAAYAMGHGAAADEATGTPAPAAWRPISSAVNAQADRSTAMAAAHETTDNVQNAPATERPPVVVTGASVGLPGTPRVFDDENVGRLLKGQIFINTIPEKFRQAMADKRITRLVKGEGVPRFEVIDNPADVIKLAGRAGELNLGADFGVPADRLPAFDPVTQLAIAAGLDALRDAGIPLVQHYKTTTKGTRLPDRWGLPDALRDETGVIFTSAFPGMDSYTEIMTGYFRDRGRRDQLELLRELRGLLNGDAPRASAEIDRRVGQISAELEKDPFVFERRFLLRVLSMGHSQFAELIGARGPNTQINSACASSTMALGLAEDWIRAGRCRRVVIVGADNITSDNLLEWFAAGFLASGAAATDERVEEAALPFDRRRHGLLMGMGAAGVVVEHPAAVRERGLQPICEVIETVSGNSAFHGTRLDVEHISGLMEQLVEKVEQKTGIRREAIAEHLMFVSHETYTPARGGSASAEVMALRKVFGADTDKIVVANSKGYTGHPMAVGIEDVLAVKALETGIVPPVANFKEVDPELGPLNLSRGGDYPVEWAMRLAAGFGSQISLSLMRWTPLPDRSRRAPDALGYLYRVVDRATFDKWLANVSGLPTPELEVVNRTLRIKSASSQPAASTKPALQPATTGAVAATREVVSAERAPIAVAPAPSTIATTPAAVATIVATAPKPPVAAPPAAVAATATPSVPATAESVKETILALVVEKTGYPAEMLDPELDLEADLGVDTVKQAELMATVRAKYDIPRDDKLKLRDFPTLNHVIKFVLDRLPKPAAPAPQVGAELARPVAVPVADDHVGAERPVVPAPAVVAPASAPSVTVTAESVKETILALVVEKTGYPAEMLDPELDLEADLGVDTVKQAELMATIRAKYDIPRDDKLKLRDFPTLNHVIQFVLDRVPKPAVASAPQVGAELARPVAVPVADDHVGAEPARPGAAPPTVAPASAPSVTVTPESVKETILALVVEKTGYPAEMLDLELDLEADLGVDTVKQAELMATIRAKYDIPRDDKLKLRDFPTLNHVIQFVLDRLPKPAVAPAPQLGAALARPVAVPVADDHVGAELARPGAAPPVVVAPSAPSVTVTAESVKETILALVVEKTGYPAEMLDLELDLEADLGVDTVKQAELMATIRAKYDIARDDKLKLRDFPTLNHVIQFVLDRLPNPAVPPAPQAGAELARPADAPLAPLADAPSSHDTRRSERPTPVVATPPMSFDAANRIPRRVPSPVMRPRLDFCPATGVTLNGGRRVLVMADDGWAADVLTNQLHLRGVVPLVIHETLLDAPFEALLDDYLAAGPISGVYWLPALDREPDIDEMTIAEWREAARRRVKMLFRAMRRLYPHMDSSDAFLVAATRCGGQHGYDEQGSLSVLGGGVAGIVKAFKRERPQATVKVVDFDGQSAEQAARDLIDETLRDPAVVEVGYRDGIRWTIGLAEQPAGNGHPGMTFSKDSVFVVTGAAGSIVSAIVADLASASGGIFYLLDRVPEPDRGNPDLTRYREDRDGLKRDLAARMQARGERVTPVMVERELAAIERSAAALEAIHAVESHGGLAIYSSVDLTDASAVAAAIDAVRAQNGRIDVLVHAAGIEISRFVPDKLPAEFDRVFDVKADGWFNLLKAIGNMPLGAAVVFSSIAGRFGNGGQTDYSAANDLLCKSISNFRLTRPDTQGIAIDWTAWRDIGMASRGSIPRMMEMAGIDMLPSEAAIPIVRRELTMGTVGEVVIAGRLGVMLEELDHVGIDVHAPAVTQELRASGPMIGTVASMTPSSGMVVETSLDPRVQPFLFDHRIEGTAVLPGVMGVEAFAELARLLLPGYHIASIDDVHFNAAFKFFRDEPRTLTLHASFRPNADGIVARCQLIGRRQIPTQPEPQETVHFTGTVHLSRQAPAIQRFELPVPVQNRLVLARDIYRVYFHGSSYRVVESAWRSGDVAVGRFAPNLGEMHTPPTRPILMAPRLLELCFQTAGLLELGTRGRLALPHRIKQVTTYIPDEHSDTPLYALVRQDAAEKSFDADVVDERGRVHVRLRGYRTVEAPIEFAAADLRPLQVAMTPDEQLAEIQAGVAVQRV